MNFSHLHTADIIWISTGLIGQLLFGGRFLVQWLASEMQHKSVIPVAFWYLSIGGGIVLLAYALHLRDPVFILGQLMGLGVYARNLFLIRAEKSIS
jgi:lipid-A-disaccharide synthase-like uncharacterized protein